MARKKPDSQRFVIALLIAHGWQVVGKCQAVGNGVPMAMGRALARAVQEYCTAESGDHQSSIINHH